jgi:hypothetical protein
VAGHLYGRDVVERKCNCANMQPREVEMSSSSSFSGRGIQIDANRIRIGNNTYSVNSISSVTTKADQIGDAHDGCLMVFFAPIIGLFAGGAAALVGYRSQGVSAILIIAVAVGCLTMLWSGIKKIFWGNRYYYIYVHLANGQILTLTNTELDAHQRLLEAINTAMASRH